MLFYRQPQPDAALLAQHVTDAVQAGAGAVRASAARSVEWNKAALISDAIKEVLARAQAQDAATGDAGARAGDGPAADAVASTRCWNCSAATTVLGARAAKYLYNFQGSAFTHAKSFAIISLLSHGGIAQLGERLHGMQEVSGSIPLTSTTDS